jgi:hypothetical protein
MTTTATSFTLMWGPVTGAASYTVQYSQDPTFATGSQTGIVNAPLTAYTVTGREPETTYHVRVKSYPNLPGSDTASDYSAAQSIQTLSVVPGEMPEGDTVTHLQHWMMELQALNVVTLQYLPELAHATLSQAERRRRLNSGVRRYGFIDKVSDTVGDFPQFWPGDVADIGVLKDKLREIEVLRNLMVLFRWLARLTEDRLLTVSHEALRMANAYYKSVRDAFMRQSPEAEQVFRLLELFHRRSRSGTPGEPTQKKVVSNVKAIQRGRKCGQVLVTRKADTITRGETRTVVETEPNTPRLVVKETLNEVVE